MNLLPVAIAAAVVAAAVLLEGQLKWLTIGLSLLIVGLLLDRKSVV